MPGLTLLNLQPPTARVTTRTPTQTLFMPYFKPQKDFALNTPAIKEKLLAQGVKSSGAKVD